MPIFYMNDFWLKYNSQKSKNNPLSEILNCGNKYDRWVTIALNYLPKEVFFELKNKFAVFSTAERDACRIAPAISKERQIILLSDRILPKRGASEENADVRYFIFCLLHEIAHVFKNHRSPFLDGLTKTEMDVQESEANELALNWFNNFIKSRKNSYLKPIEIGEIERSKIIMQKLMKDLYEND